MGFLEVVTLATLLLQREKRISCRALGLILELDDACLEDLKFESELKEDIGFYSIALMSLVYELQELYPNFDGTSIYKWNTLGDIVDDLSKFS